nr:MAG TPA: hypothetical protein [Crassvirales sp.]
MCFLHKYFINKLVLNAKFTYICYYYINNINMLYVST